MDTQTACATLQMTPIHVKTKTRKVLFSLKSSRFHLTHRLGKETFVNLPLNQLLNCRIFCDAASASSMSDHVWNEQKNQLDSIAQKL